MDRQKEIEISQYNYHLPADLVPARPAEERGRSRLLQYAHGAITDRCFSEISQCLPDGGLLAANDTKVIPARMHFSKDTGAGIEIFCLEPCLPADYQAAFDAVGRCRWNCMVGNLKKWKSGKLSKTLSCNGQELVLQAEITSRAGSYAEIEFSWGANISFGQLIWDAGSLPIPPYLGRETEEADYDRYQTVFAAGKGSVAAPTAGLHFTPEILETIESRGIKQARLTLHVGAGTFRPVQADTIGGHQMHSETYIVRRSALQAMLENLGSITAVGTTSVRTMESLYWAAEHLNSTGDIPATVEQWAPYSSPAKLSPAQALELLLEYCSKKGTDKISGHTKIIIAPGYQWKFTDQLITNFHQPQSTLLLLVSAFVGENWKNIYEHAINNKYRFLSYGDSSVLSRL
jgi:S-adenosylmethionine:tRNA ribosyltransferase-isomerase